MSLLALPAHGGCALPLAPSKFPDGATASEPELLAAMQTLKRYSIDVSNYLKCLEFEASQQRLSREDQAARHNAAVDGLQATSVKFNEQVRLFKARTP
jgi:hypothetical protein